ncbi:MAG: YbaN family protein [Gammaproteobacteria bacterium]|nr:YbaN family protein [Gammaproteobacteria bacterium]NNJ84546.1 YbaN family protein [Gammaproteobacteria bacterium]
MTGQKPLNGSVRALLIILGTLCVALGVLGMLLPLLPTTPFLLLAATCYSRSSERFYHWLVTNPWFGEYIRNYREGIGISLKQKALTIFVLWLVIGSTAWLATSQGWVRWILLGVAVGVTVHLVKMRTYQSCQRSVPSDKRH